MIVCWTLALSAVWLWTVCYEFSTYRPTDEYARRHWPSDSTVELEQDRSTLVLFLHPKCPCTRASIRELDRLLTGTGLTSEQQPRVLVLACQPAAVTGNWHDTDVMRKAAELPRAEIVVDREGSETNRFGAVSSGTVMLFDTDGSRLFAGGVTSSRGHEGDNAGCNALKSMLTGRAEPSTHSTPAFGCKLSTSS